MLIVDYDRTQTGLVTVSLEALTDLQRQIVTPAP